jgi:hypothetical protein
VLSHSADDEEREQADPHLSASNCPERLADDRPFLGQIVADRGRRDAAFAHCVADLIEPLHDIAGCVESRHVGALVIVDASVSSAVSSAPTCLASSTWVSEPSAG